jgi:hypothetical protein
MQSTQRSQLGSSVVIVTRLLDGRPENWTSISYRFFSSFLCAIPSAIQWVPEMISPVLKRSGSAVTHSFLSSVDG